jgi:16S rRNA processing protein RimM
MVILLLEGVVNQNDAIRYKNKIISINRDDARLDADAWFIEDIIGLPVFDESGAPLGTLAEVLFLPAGQVYVVKGDQEHLVPAVPEFVKNVDLTAGRVTVSLIEGM